MRILVVGAGGFIGGRVVAALLGRGHAVTCAGRDPAALRRRFPPCRAVRADLLADDTRTWMPCLVGTDAVVNAAGALRGDLEGVHHRGTVALFEACAAAGVPRVLQLSALGADAQATSAYHLSKKAADDALLAIDGLDATVVQPSLVFGLDGASSQRLLTLASLPAVPLPGGGGQWVQPVHIDDVVAAVLALLAAVAVDRHGQTAVVRALARPQRAPRSVSAFG
jgi:uncharacterized protein YbjT (DUF2867 family)